jgi:hypothetical protein
VLVGTAMLFVLGCHGTDPDTTPPSFGKRCESDLDCLAPFTCIGVQLVPGNCAKTCRTDADCPAYHWNPPCGDPDYEADVQSNCDDGVCHAFIACQ